MALTSRERDLARAARGGFEDFQREWIRQGRPEAEAGGGYNQFSVLDPDGEYDHDDFSRRSNRRGRSVSNSDAPTTLGGWVKAGLATQYRENEDMAAREFQTMDSVLDILVDEQGKLRGIGDMMKNIATDAGMALILNFKQQNDLLMKINERTGMLGVLSRAFREEITEAYPHALRLGISFETLSESITAMMEQSGKFRLLGRETIEEMALASKFADNMKDYANMAGNFERVSLGIHDMTVATNRAGKDSMAIGLNARQTVNDISANLEKLNTYGFRRGVEGLTEMVQKSIEFRMNINAATNLAEKVWSPEGALDVVANLQVLGGAVGALNDPLQLMYMATNNVEGLQDAIIGASKSLVTYNEEQGRFEVTGANLRRAKEMAKELGMEMSELTTTAVASMERTQAASDLMSQGLNMSERDREFLINMAQMKEGRMVIEVPESLAEAVGGQTEVALGNMSQEMAALLIREREQLESKTMEEVAREQVSLIENINRDVSFITATMRIQSSKLTNDLAAAIGYDPLEAALESKRIADRVQEKIDVDLLYDAMNKTLGTNLKHQTVGLKPLTGSDRLSEGATLTEPTTTTEPTTQKVEGTLNITVNSPTGEVDRFAREMVNNPNIVPPMRDSFLNMMAGLKQK